MEILLRLNREELRVAHQALNEICNVEQHIPNREFEKRIGATRDEARLVLAKIAAVLNAPPLG